MSDVLPRTPWWANIQNKSMAIPVHAIRPKRRITIRYDDVAILRNLGFIVKGVSP
jgi:hypothetical protein